MGSSKEKPKGWHSRRHQSRDAQDEARERYKQGRGPNMRKGRKRKK